jgi:hypothetical protein
MPGVRLPATEVWEYWVRDEDKSAFNQIPRNLRCKIRKSEIVFKRPLKQPIRYETNPSDF